MANQPEHRDRPGDAPGLSRRDSLKWLGLLLAGGTLTAGGPGLAAPPAGTEPWRELKMPPVKAGGYGTDPDLITPTAPWPRTLTSAELATVTLLADILVPREGSVPSASELHVPDVVDEWVSAPYAPQQRDRVAIRSLLRWLDDEAAGRFGKTFTEIGDDQRIDIVEDIAWHDTDAALRPAAAAFDRLRQVVLAAFYCTPEGRADLGYLGGKVIAGDYPGPTGEATRHLEDVLASLELEPYRPRTGTGADEDPVKALKA